MSDIVITGNNDAVVIDDKDTINKTVNKTVNVTKSCDDEFLNLIQSDIAKIAMCLEKLVDKLSAFPVCKCSKEA